MEIHYSVHTYMNPWEEPRYLFLQHGYGRSSRFWYNLIPYLARWYVVVCTDLRGLGESSMELDLSRDLSVAAYISDILAVADEIGAPTFHYAGESFGGILGLALAADHAQRIRTLSLFSTPLSINAKAQELFAFGHASMADALRTMGSEAWASAANGATRFPPGTDPGLLAWYAAEMGKSDVDVMIAMSALITSLDARPYLSRIEAPVLGFFPQHGSIAVEDQIETMQETIGEFRCVRMPTTFHMVQTLYPRHCAEHVLAFISRHDGLSCQDSSA